MGNLCHPKSFTDCQKESIIVRVSPLWPLTSRRISPTFTSKLSSGTSRELHQGKSKWHSYHVLVYISPVLTYLLGTVSHVLWPWGNRKTISTHNPLSSFRNFRIMIPSYSIPICQYLQWDHDFGILTPRTWEPGFASFHSWTNPGWTSSTKISPSSLSTRRPNLWPMVRSTKTLYLQLSPTITHWNHSKGPTILLMAEILHQLRLVVYPIIYRVSYIPGG